MNPEPQVLNGHESGELATSHRPRKLLVLTEIISPYRIPVFNALARRPGIDLHVIFFAETDPTQRHWQVYKDEIRFSYEVLPSWRRRIGGYNVLLNRGMGSSLRRATPDVIICGGYNYLASWQAWHWARQRGVPFMVWVESTSLDRRSGYRLLEFLKRKFMGSCNGFIVAGKSSAEYVKKNGAREGSVFTAPDAVDTHFFAERGASARRNGELHRRTLGLPRRFFLFVGRLVAEKGVFDLLQAYGSLPADFRQQVGLVFAGEGSDRPQLQSQAGSVTCGTVQFVGFLQREELPTYYALAEALVFPTHSDPWGLVVNEAMACGLPIICSTAAGCAADLVEDGWNGRLVRPGDSSELASAIGELAQNSSLRVEMGEHSWERIQRHSPESCAAGIAEAVAAKGVRPHV